MNLEKRFGELFNREKPWLTSRPLFGKLEKNYFGREYHGLNHVKNCLKYFDDVKRFLKNPDVVEMAIFYHDAIYDLFYQDNEEKSAELAKRELGNVGFPREFLKNVYDLILVTKDHIPNSNPDSKFISDIDLREFGMDYELFLKNSEKIRKEYSVLPNFTNEAFNLGRKDFLGEFLKRDKIFHSDYFQIYESSARENIQRYLDSSAQKNF